jgi:hypothetical protein
MDDVSVVVKRHAYQRYFKDPELLEPIFHLFLTQDDSTYLMREVHARCNVPITTLYSWRERVRADPDWRPTREHFSENRRILPDEIEAIIADYIRVTFVEPGRPLTRPTLKPLVLMFVQSLVAENVLTEDFLNFSCSYHFLSRFLQRVGLSFRRARPERRPSVDDQECAHFMAKLVGAFHQYPPDYILNFDESNWHLVMAGEQTVAPRGAETVHQYTEGDAKANFTFFATITAGGAKLPLILIAKGKTDRCHKQFGSHDAYDYEIWHSPTGWCTEPLMIRYLHWLRHRIPEEPLCLVMDQFTAHTPDQVQAEADQLDIEIIWVPKGATGRYQPLDRRTFGALKSKGKAKWRIYFNDHYGVKCTKEIGAALLLASWDELSESCVSAGWDFDEPPEENDDESDDSDDDFELGMTTSSEDEDMNVIGDEDGIQVIAQ